jgi:hypothetical protein
MFKSPEANKSSGIVDKMSEEKERMKKGGE